MKKILLRLDDDSLFDRLKAAAKADHRSVNAELVVALTAFLDGRDKIAHLISEEQKP